jgi:hypothetical protein
MGLIPFARCAFIFLFLLVLLTGCAAPPRGPIEPPAFPDAWMNSKWGDSIEEVKRAIEKDGNRMFQEDTERPPYAIYASGTFLEQPAILSYFFTPKSKKLYRVDVTYHNPDVYAKVRGEMIQRFKSPTYSKGDVDHWSWKDDSLIIVQKTGSLVQVSYSNGVFSKLNHQEGNGLLGK